MNLKKAINKIIRKTRNASNIKEIKYDSLVQILKNNSNVILIDTRSPQEFAENRINSAINIPLYDIEKMANFILPNKNALIVLYCQSGYRSKKSFKILEKLGYTNLYDLEGGLDNI